MRFKILIILTVIFFYTQKNLAQEINVDDINAITTAAPFLLITPDGRAAGMGDVGVATTPDFNSQHHNPSKAAFNDMEFSIGVNFTPWMREIVNDVYLGGFSVTNKLNERSAWATSFKYFTYGEIQLTDDQGDPLGPEKPYEMALDGTYALKLSESFSLGVTLRLIHSDFALKKALDSDLEPATSFGVDVSGYYESAESNYGDFNGIFRGGFNIANIGPKVSYVPGGAENFIPTNMKLGGGFDFILDDYNKVGVTLETTKLLVPTPNPDVDEEAIGFFEGMIGSFGDAPGGFSEEMKEFTWGVGAEYMYSDAFAFRSGYFHENSRKGARSFLTIGAGFNFKSTSIDFSYLINTSFNKNPLENSLRFSLGFNLGESYSYF